jgi:hemoglobin
VAWAFHAAILGAAEVIGPPANYRAMPETRQDCVRELGAAGVGRSGGRVEVMQSVYEAAGGEQGLRRLAGAWHSRVLADEVVSHAFQHGYHPQHTERLAAYWGEALGGPDAGIDETAVVRMHSGNGPHEDMDNRAIACFDLALADAGLTGEPLRQVLHDYFAWATRTAMTRYHHSADDVPDGLRVPRWSWDGLQASANQ